MVAYQGERNGNRYCEKETKESGECVVCRSRLKKPRKGRASVRSSRRFYWSQGRKKSGCLMKRKE